MKQAYSLLLLALLSGTTALAQPVVFSTAGNAENGFVNFNPSPLLGYAGIEDYNIDVSTFANPDADSFELVQIQVPLVITNPDGLPEGASIDVDIYSAAGAFLGTPGEFDLGQSGFLTWTLNFAPGTLIPTNGFIGVYLDSTDGFSLAREPALAWGLTEPQDPDDPNSLPLTGVVGTSPVARTGLSGFRTGINFAVVMVGREIQGTLPVELAAFDAEADARGVELAWTTAQEYDNAGFEVERSTDGDDFAAVAFVEGAGSADAATDYDFTDVTVASGATYYYRLRQVDFDGAETISPVRAVSTGRIASELIAEDFAPNPARGLTSIEVVLREDAELTTELFDVTGKRVLVRHTAAEAGVVTEGLDVSALPAGVYQAVITAGAQMFQRRLTVQ